jgi:molecular chaperone GrpE
MSKDKKEKNKKTDEEIDKQDKSEEYLNNWKRAVADLENYKKDQAKLMGEFRKFATLDVIFQILPVLDNFNASLEHVPEKEKDNAWVTGITHIKKQLEDVLKNNGVEEIEVKIGDEFDPEMHEAVQDTKEANIDTNKTNKIAKVVQKGYKINNKIIRAAKVTVG